MLFIGETVFNTNNDFQVDCGVMKFGFIEEKKGSKGFTQHN